MARLTVRMPDSLKDVIARRADEEGVSLNQFIVFALTQAASADLLREQRERYDAVLNSVPPDEAETALRGLLESRQ
jgi:uncharacterized protein (DUF1778 family)